MVQIIRREIDLLLDAPAVSWQVIEGNGQTWIILRSKLRLVNEDIVELGQLFLESNSYELAEVQQESFLYKGKIKLQASYYSKNNGAKELNCPEAASDEYEAREKLLFGGECPLHHPKTEPAPESIFLSTIYEDLPVSPLSIADGQSVWELEMPWQGWLEGGELQAQPEVAAAHLGQVGLETLLCEVLISLTAKAAIPAVTGMVGGNYFLAGEEVSFHIPGARVDKVIGSAIKRAFYEVKPGKSSVDLDYLIRFNLVYVSSQQGGERILTAWGLIPQALKLPLRSQPALPLCVVKVQTEKIVLAPAGEQKVVMKEQLIVTMGDGNTHISEVQPVLAACPEKEIQAVAQVAEIPRPTVVRPRPGEKWLKKHGESAQSPYNQKKVLAVKLVAQK